jgi:hypothetical protein
MPRKQTVGDFASAARLAEHLPGIEVAESYRTQSLKVKGKLIARVWEDGVTLVLRQPLVVRDHLMRQDPAVFFLTDHYRDYPYVLVRLTAVAPATLQALIEDAWREVAPKRLLQAWDDGATRPARGTSAVRPRPGTPRKRTRG